MFVEEIAIQELKGLLAGSTDIMIRMSSDKDVQFRQVLHLSNLLHDRVERSKTSKNLNFKAVYFLVDVNQVSIQARPIITDLMQNSGAQIGVQVITYNGAK